MQKNLRINDDVTVGPQPSAEQLAGLRRQGLRYVANLRADGEDKQPLSPADEGARVESLGMGYYNEPVEAEAMSEAQVNGFRDRFAALPKPVFAHCKTGKRAGALVMMDLAVRQGISGDATLEQAERIGFECKEPQLRQFVKGYVDARANGGAQ